MLSVLIPTYNHLVSNLLVALDKMLCTEDFEYEILCLEDGSNLYVEENEATCKTINKATHYISKKNKGRITSRLFLAQHAKYDLLLFLDADVETISELFIKSYSQYFKQEYKAIYGGYTYSHNPPESDYILRWKYGKKYEAINASIRNKMPYKVVISGNFMIDKQIFLDINSQINSDGYGYDNVFGAVMKVKHIKVLHIDNNVLHLGLDKNPIFLRKTENAVTTLHSLYLKNKKKATENSLLELYKRLKGFGLDKLITILYKSLKNSIRKHLLGKSPNMLLFQFYKLGYLCSLSTNKK